LKCPAHDDAKESLSLTAGEGGKVLVKCHAGCAQEAVIDELKARGLWPEREAKKPRGEIDKRYEYRDAKGKLLFEVVRLKPKDFRQRKPDGKDGWIWNIVGVIPVPYRLPEVIAAAEVFVVEGEKDADALAKRGVVATCNPGGAGKGKWKKSYSAWLEGKRVVILPDNDDAGREHAEAVARSLSGVAASVRVVALPDLPPKGDVSDWLDRGGDVATLRALAEATPEWAPDADEVIMEPGALIAIVDRAEAALLDSGIYQRAGELVRPVRLDKSIEEGGVRRAAGALVLVRVGETWLVEAMARKRKWLKWTRNGWEPADPDPKYARHLLGRVGEWRFPVLRSVLTTPTMTVDGRVIQEPGYDEKTGLLLDFEAGAFPRVTDRPTKEEAAAALALLARPFRKYDFKPSEKENAPSAARAVALSVMLCAVVRANLRTCPLHVADAPEAGSGKTYLLECAGILATGAAPAAMNQGKSPEEDEKRLGAVLMAGDPVILIDNCDRPIEGDFLCSMLTSEVVQPRVLGLSKTMKLPSTALTMACGNNVVLAGDTTRRAVICRIEPGVERPDTREFDFDPRDEVRAGRPELVAAALTVLRAYVVAGRPAKLKPYGSFADYDLIRGALVWLGEADPVDTREPLFADDPKRNELADVMDAWEAAFDDRSVDLAELREEPVGADRESDTLRVLRERLMEAAVMRGAWSGTRAGGWLRRHKGKVLAGQRFHVEEESPRHFKWRLVGARSPAEEGASGELPFSEPRPSR
jgi:hypothetical protein